METSISNKCREEHKLNFQQRPYSNKPIFFFFLSHNVCNYDDSDDNSLTFSINNNSVILYSRFKLIIYAVQSINMIIKIITCTTYN